MYLRSFTLLSKVWAASSGDVVTLVNCRLNEAAAETCARRDFLRSDPVRNEGMVWLQAGSASLSAGGQEAVTNVLLALHRRLYGLRVVISNVMCVTFAIAPASLMCGCRLIGRAGSIQHAMQCPGIHALKHRQFAGGNTSHHNSHGMQVIFCLRVSSPCPCLFMQ